MATRSKKTFWLVAVVLFVIVLQLAVIGFIIINLLNRNEVAQRPPPQAAPAQNRPVQGQNRNVQPAAQRQAVSRLTPGAKTKPTGPRAEPPTFSREGGVFTNYLTVELKAPSAKAVVRYTLDGSSPSEQSPAYTAPISIQSSLMVRAASFEPGKGPSTIITHAFTQLDETVRDFNSNLPLVVIDTAGQYIGHQNYIATTVRFVGLEGERSRLTGPVEFDGVADIKRRGYTSIRYPKASMTLKFRDGDGDKVKSPLYGMPSESDWVLYAPYVDKTLMRDVLGYELSNQMGRYAPRTRFVEVFIRRSPGKLSMRDYAGVYVLVEKIKRGKERVNIAKLKPEDNQEPEITGGYILKRDHTTIGGGRGFSAPRALNDGNGFVTPNGLHLYYVEPEENELTKEQQRWISGYMARFERALNGSGFASPSEGYAKYLDVEAFIDQFWLIEYTKNIDGFRYSAFLHKPRGGKLIMGPAWDWNLSFGNADNYDVYEPQGWYYENLRDTEISWIYRLRQDPDFMQKLIDRWAELRRGPYATDKVLGLVNRLRTQLDESQQRNFRTWRVLGRTIRPNYFVGQTYDEEVNWMKVWIKDRGTWIDRQFPRTPALSVKPGPVAAGTKVSLTADSGEVYYTLDGSDPRATGGNKAAAARKYEGPVTVAAGTKFTARLKRGSVWSAPTQPIFTGGN